MTGCLTIDDLARLNHEPIEEMRRTASALDPSDPDSCEIFTRQVTLVEAALKQTYKAAALLAKRTDTPEQEGAVWRRMREFADVVIEALKQLKDLYPSCGTPELYNLALDYRLAADKRLSLTNESIQCQSLPTPDGLFPQVT